MIEEFAVPAWVHLLLRMTGRHLRRSTGWKRRRHVPPHILPSISSDDGDLPALGREAAPVSQSPADIEHTVESPAVAEPQPPQGRMTQRFLEAAIAMEERTRSLVTAVDQPRPSAQDVRVPAPAISAPAPVPPAPEAPERIAPDQPRVESIPSAPVAMETAPVTEPQAPHTPPSQEPHVAEAEAVEAEPITPESAPAHAWHAVEPAGAEESIPEAAIAETEPPAAVELPQTVAQTAEVPEISEERAAEPLSLEPAEQLREEPAHAEHVTAPEPEIELADAAQTAAPSVDSAKPLVAVPEQVSEAVIVPEPEIDEEPAAVAPAAETAPPAPAPVPAPAPAPAAPDAAAAAAIKSAASTVLAPAVLDEYNRTGLDFRLPMPRPKVRGLVIDWHCHLLARKHAEDWFEAADHYGINVFLTMTPLEEATALARDYGRRLRFIAVPKWGDNEAGWVDRWRSRIEAFYNLGSRIAKFHASPGTMVMRGHRLDSPVYEPLFAELKARGMAIMTHIGDPDTWYNGRYSDAGKFGTRDEHYQMWESLLEAHRGTPWVGAHMGGNPEDLPRLQRLLDRFPDLMLDCSATRWMQREISARREPAREFFIRNQDRILFGSDQVSGDDRHFDFLASRFWCHRKLWETAYIGPSPIIDPDLPKDQQPQLRGLALPDVVLQKIYHDNATKLLAKIGMSFEQDNA